MFHQVCQSVGVSARRQPVVLGRQSVPPYVAVQLYSVHSVEEHLACFQV